MSANKPHMLIASRNAGKLAEFRRLLGDSFEVADLSDWNLELPEEGVESYRANAEAKARCAAQATGLLTLGDDSGIEVMALDGRPGIISARFAGEPVSDQRNITKLLDELDATGSTDRSARFVCWLTVANGDGDVVSVEGTCAGTIGVSPRGTNGFGYDPIFLFADGRTMAELTNEEKDLASHRGNAVRAMLPVIRKAIESGDGDA